MSEGTPRQHAARRARSVEALMPGAYAHITLVNVLMEPTRLERLEFQ